MRVRSRTRTRVSRLLMIGGAVEGDVRDMGTKRSYAPAIDAGLIGTAYLKTLHSVSSR